MSDSEMTRRMKEQMPDKMKLSSLLAERDALRERVEKMRMAVQLLFDHGVIEMPDDEERELLADHNPEQLAAFDAIMDALEGK